jgi:hypothetical protein
VLDVEVVLELGEELEPELVDVLEGEVVLEPEPPVELVLEPGLPVDPDGPEPLGPELGGVLCGCGGAGAVRRGWDPE